MFILAPEEVLEEAPGEEEEEVREDEAGSREPSALGTALLASTFLLSMVCGSWASALSTA